MLGLRFCARAFLYLRQAGATPRAGLSLSWPLLLRSTGSRYAGSVVVAHGPSCSAACGIFPDQGSNLCALHWQADSQPLHHQGSPGKFIFKKLISFCDAWLVTDRRSGDRSWVLAAQAGSERLPLPRRVRGGWEPAVWGNLLTCLGS